MVRIERLTDRTPYPPSKQHLHPMVGISQVALV
jgi:hypothetical protein